MASTAVSKYQNHRRFALSWCIGIIGGTLLFFEQVPLAWLLGSMVASSIAALSGLEITTWIRLTPWARCVLGVMVGTGITPIPMAELISYGETLAMVPLFLLGSISLNYWMLRRMFRQNAATALFSALPGGMVEMITTGREYGADPKFLTTVHLIRVIAIVAGAAFLGAMVGLADFRMQTPAWDHWQYVPLHLLLGVVGWRVGVRLRIPSASLLAPMFMVTALQASDVLHMQLFTPLIIVAQVIIGIDIARSFNGVSLRAMRIPFIAAGMSVLVMTAVLAVLALAILTLRADLPLIQVVLSFLPGGQTELALLAFALKLDLTFVVTHQIFRIALIMFSLPLFIVWLTRWRRPDDSSSR